MIVNKIGFVARSVLKLSSANVIAQALAILILPFLARLYSPEQFGEMSLFLSVASILTISMTLRYEQAIVLSKFEKEANALRFISLSVATFLALILTVVIFVFWLVEFAWYLDLDKSLGGVTFFLPLAAVLHCYYKIYFNQLNRNSSYSRISVISVIFSVSQALMKLLIGLAFAVHSGLILGLLFGRLVTLIASGRGLWGGMPDFLSKKKRTLITFALKKYSSFPKLLLLSDIINAVALQLPFFLILYYYDKENVGYFALAYSVTSVPLTFLGNAISTVFRREVAIANASGRCVSTVFSIFLKNIVLITLPLFVFVYFITPVVFTPIFGSEWGDAATIVQLLCVLFFFQFNARILSYIYILKNKQLENLMIQICLIVLVYLVFKISNYLELVFFDSIFVYSLVYSAVYITVILRAYSHSKE